MVVVVLLAMVAAFLALRLYSVLGKRTGAEPLPKTVDDRPLAVPARSAELPAEPRDAGQRHVEAGAEAGLRQVIAADPAFDVPQFLEGAKGAYRMVLEAFWKNDRETLEWLAEADVRAAFEEAIETRRAAGHQLDNRLVAIERASIVDAGFERGVARIGVRFDADIVAVTRDADGQVVAGSMSDSVETHDVWTFTRTLASSDPNWKLADTDEA